MVASTIRIYEFSLMIASFVTKGTNCVQIPNSYLWTDSNYRISAENIAGFNILTYAYVYTKLAEKFVMLDDHREREKKYASGGEWFQDALWTFKVYKENKNVFSIHPVLYPGYKLVLDSFAESPGDNVQAQNYLILSNSQQYDEDGINNDFKNGLWEIVPVDDSKTLYYIRSFANRASVFVPPRVGDNYRRWVTVSLLQRTVFKITAATA